MECEETGKSAKFKVTWALVFLAGAVLLIASASGEFWFDEAWSALLVAKAGGPAGVFFIKNDNSHFLNSVFLSILGPGKPALVYRAPSVLAGLATLFMVWRLVRGWSERAGLMALSLTAVSYPLVLYFSEARGYGTAVAFALGSMIAAKSSLERGKPADRFYLWLFLVGGMLSHLAFAATFISIVLYASYRLWKNKKAPREIGFGLAGLFAVPAIVTASYALIYTAGIEHGAGSHSGWLDAVSLFAQSLAGQVTDKPFHPAALAFIPIILLFAWVSRRDGIADWPMIFTMLAVAPLIGFLISFTVPLFYMRFLMPSAPFFLLGAAYVLSVLTRWPGRIVPALAWMLCALMILTNLYAVAGLIRYGRAHYGELVADLLKTGIDGPIDVTGDSMSRHVLMIDHHLERMGLPGAIRFWYDGKLIARYSDPVELYAKYLPRPGVEHDDKFFIAHGRENEFPGEKINIAGKTYNLLKIYPYFGGPSGWDLYLYAKESVKPGG